MSKVKINYNNTFATKHSRDYYRGASFHFSGKWIIGAHYISDDYNIDFVVHDQVLLACAKSHLSSLENKPINFIRDERGTVIGVISIYWDFVCSGIVGNSPGVKIANNYWWICEDVNLPVEQQVWVNTGVKAKLEFSDLTPEEIAELTQPGIDAAINTINSKIKQTTGSSESDLMSQKAITDEFVNVALDIADINAKIPIDASSDNQLADKEYVNEHIATATATFQGTYNLVTDLELNVDATREQISSALDNEITNPDNNDYCFVQIPTSISEPTEIKKVERYKFNGTNWAFEYELNNSGFTNAQWAAINSGVVTNDVTKLRALPTKPVNTAAQVLTNVEKKQARINIGAREVKHFSIADGEALLIPLEDECSLAMTLQMDFVYAMYVISTTPSNPGLVRIVDNQVGTNYWNFAKAQYNGVSYYIMITNDGEGDGIVVSLSPLGGDLDGVEVIDTEHSVITDITQIVPETFETSSNKVTSISSSSTNVQYPSAKVVYDALVANDKVFVATYGITLFNDVKAVFDAGEKIVICYYNSEFYFATYYATSDQITFVSVQGTPVKRLLLNSSGNNNGWANGGTLTLQASNRVSSWQASPDDTHYPSEKLVYDSLYPATQSSEPSGGMLPNVLYNFGTLSGDTTFSVNTSAAVPGVNHYYWMFDTPATAPTITWPTGITWADGAAPTILGSKHYEISLLNGVAIAMEV